MRVAVTGASGHIGNCLVRELKKQGADVKVLVYQFRNDLDEMNVECIQGSLFDMESLEKLCAEVDVVFHLAAQISIDNRQAEQVFSTNVTGTINILEAARKCGVRKFIHFSSIDAFQAEPKEQILDENRLLIQSKDSAYGFSKAESEREVLKAVKLGLEAVILSPTAVIGPFDYRGSILGKALRKMFQNKMPFLVFGGYNWVDVRDVASAAIQAIEHGRKGEKYILSGNFANLKDLSVVISKIADCRIPLIVPISLVRLVCPFFQVYASLTRTEPLFTNHSLDLLLSSPENISCEKARIELNYKPRQLEETLRDAYFWYMENKQLN